MAGNKDIATMIYEDFSEKILSLEYKPGMPFSENDVCEMYKASRTPVRTALQRLADKGLIDLLPYQKTMVSKIDLEAVKQLIYSRAAIEDRVIRDFMTLDDPLLIEDVEHLIRKQQIVLASEDFSLEQFYELDAKMHRLWYEAAGALPVWEFFQESIHYTRLRKLDILEKSALSRIIHEHSTILELIRKKDSADIYQLLHAHLYGGIERLAANEELAGYIA